LDHCVLLSKDAYQVSFSLRTLLQETFVLVDQKVLVVLAFWGRLKSGSVCFKGWGLPLLEVFKRNRAIAFMLDYWL